MEQAWTTKICINSTDDKLGMMDLLIAYDLKQKVIGIITTYRQILLVENIEASILLR